MCLKDNLPLAEKWHMLTEILSRPDLLTSNSEGSKVIVLIVPPKEETTAIRELRVRHDPKLELLDLGRKLTQAAERYGIENLEEDFSFSKNACIDDFSHLLQSLLIESIVQASERSELTAIHRLGILNGFFGLNPLIEGITGKLVHPVLFLYPGKKKEHILSFLEGRHTTSLYRAVVL